MSCPIAIKGKCPNAAAADPSWAEHLEQVNREIFAEHCADYLENLAICPSCNHTPEVKS